MIAWLFKRKFKICLYNGNVFTMRRENWREVVEWCKKTFDKKNYVCDISLSYGKVAKVEITLTNKSDYTLLALTWLEDWA